SSLVQSNVISNNGRNGILISDDGSAVPALNSLYGNNFTFNALHGIQLQNAVSTTIGGGSGQSNIISGNAANGITIIGNLASGNLIDMNSISSNGALGIDLGTNVGYDGVTPNDTGDGDSGPNGLQNFPV